MLQDTRRKIKSPALLLQIAKDDIKIRGFLECENPDLENGVLTDGGTHVERLTAIAPDPAKCAQNTSGPLAAAQCGSA